MEQFHLEFHSSSISKPEIIYISSWRYVDGSGVQRVAGDADLKRSQHYPILFGRAVAETFIREWPAIKASGYTLRPAMTHSVI